MRGDALPPPDPLDEALRDRLRALTADRIADAVYWTRADGSFLWLNDAACRMLGYDRDELMALGVLGIDPAYEPATLAAFMADLRARGRQVFRTRHRRKDGREVPVEMAVDRVPLAGREYACAVARDLTERLESEESLRRYAARLEDRQRFIDHVLDTSPDVLWVHDFVTQRTVYLGGQFHRVLGYTPDEVVAMGDQSLPNLLHPEDREAYRQAVLPRYATLRDGEVLPLLFRARHRDGSWRVLSAREVVHARLPDGTPTQVLGIARDVTGTRDAEARRRTILRTTLDGFWQQDRQGRFLDVNDALCTMLGYSREELLTMSISDIEAAESPEEVASHVAKVIARGHDRFETRHRRKDGTILDIEISVNLLPGPDGHCAVFARDVTARKHAEAAREALQAELERHGRELEQMLYVSSHDLRSPLLNIQGFASILALDLRELRATLQGVPLPAEARAAVDRVLGDSATEALSFIDSGVQRMDGLLTGMLKVSRAGRIAVEPAVVPMDTVVAEVLADLQFRVRAASVEVRVDPLPDCFADRGLVAQVFANLLDNALKYLAPSRPGRIAVSGEAAGDRCRYHVRDNGIGIAPRHAGRIFEMFQRLDPRGSPGEGIGLTIVRTLVERQGGRVWLDSEEGAGACFHVELPRLHGASSSARWPRVGPGGEA